MKHSLWPPWGVWNVTVLLMPPSLAPFSTTTPAVISENGQSFEVDPVNTCAALRRYRHLDHPPVSVGSRHGDHSCSVIFSLRTSLGWLVRQNCIYSQEQRMLNRRSLKSNVTESHQGLKQKFQAGYRVPSLKRTSHVAAQFHRRVWYHVLSLCYAWIQHSSIILIP